MQTEVTSHLQQIASSFIQLYYYDPTTYYLGDTPLDRYEFNLLKKQGLIEASFENNQGRRYTLTTKGKQQMNLA